MSEQISLNGKTYAAMLFTREGTTAVQPLIAGANPLQVLLAIDDVEHGRLRGEKVEIADVGDAAVVALVAAGPESAIGRLLLHHASPFQVRAALLALKLQAEDAVRVVMAAGTATARPVEKRSELVIPNLGLRH